MLKGNFGGEASKTFMIRKADITPAIDVASRAYNGNAIEPVIGNNPGNGNVTFYTYERRQPDHTWSTFNGTPTDAGTYRATATIAETDNYNGATTNTKESPSARRTPRSRRRRPGTSCTTAWIRSWSYLAPPPAVRCSIAWTERTGADSSPG